MYCVWMEGAGTGTNKIIQWVWDNNKNTYANAHAHTRHTYRDGETET